MPKLLLLCIVCCTVVQAASRGSTHSTSHDGNSVGIPESSWTCALEPGNQHADKRGYCMFTNLVWFQKQLYLVSTKVEPPLPSIPTSEWTSQTMHASENYELLSNFIQIVSPQQFSDITKRARADAKAQSITYKHHDLALLVRETNDPLNWWHTVDDINANPSHAVWLMHGWRDTGSTFSVLAKNYPSIAHLYQCWASDMLGVREVHQPEATEDMEVHVFAKAAAGPGPFTAHPFHSETMFLDQIDPARRAQLIAQLRRCAGLDPEPRSPPRHPHVVLFNREYTAGRGLLRLDHVAWKLRRMLPKGATLSIEFADGTSVQEQAKVFDSADVLLLPHGAGAMNLHFLPMVAAVVDVNTWQGYGKHQASIITHMPPPYRMQLFTLNKFDQSSLEPKFHDSVLPWLHGSDNSGQSNDIGQLFDIGRTNHKGLNVLLDVQETADLMMKAVMAWHAMTKQDKDGAYGSCRVHCGSTCVDTLQDDNNCGACDVPCGSSGQCIRGWCVNRHSGQFIG